jgi:hypothetical protein
MAAPRARPAARAGSPRWRVDSFPGEQHARSGIFDRLYAGAGAVRVGRGQEYRDRLPLCRERSSSLQDLCDGTGWPVTGRNTRNLVVGVAALRQQTRAIPVVFTPVADPVGQGFVQSLARPGGNLTGFSGNDAELMGKWLQLLKQVAPGVTSVAVTSGSAAPRPSPPGPTSRASPWLHNHAYCQASLSPSPLSVNLQMPS